MYLANATSKICPFISTLPLTSRIDIESPSRSGFWYIMVWWMSYFTHGVVDVRCGGCLVWWMSYFTHGVVDVWCGGCLCGGCRTIGQGCYFLNAVNLWGLVWFGRLARVQLFVEKSMLSFMRKCRTIVFNSIIRTGEDQTLGSGYYYFRFVLK